MLDHDTACCWKRLKDKRGATTRFFVFAISVKARGYKAWTIRTAAGIRFQTRPGSEPAQIIIHVRMLDKENLQQQEALGIIGSLDL